MTGIYDCFGYGAGYDVPFRERYRLIRAAGFDCVMLWWSDRFGRGEGFEQDADLARQAGLILENMHAPVHEQDLISEDNLSGDNVLHDYLKCVEDCDKYHIPTVVIHLPDDSHPLNALGNGRLDRIIDRAGELGVQVAFENLRNIRNLESTLERVTFPHIGFCYDSCHHINYASGLDLLKAYGDRLKALHLHDNGGICGQHQLPFDGKIDWSVVMENLRNIGYKGAVTLEPMNWDYSQLDIRSFLKLAHERAERLEQTL
ncbi:sugar phosphate isomerase/epimerase family protein [Ruminococcus albus]|uniref:Sugar phosphate isomerase/epimerase n=1 Tax=Ruminococcus albus TaxID=1264 RepID=A0A1H7IAJ5_RUMAL|nr:sugar phosphate isomerase/epimerase family protein [Ruminococcus albus]SEK59374.1 Sugar phosphate isomerase/epimerase [Ruminococcus albus]